MSERGGRSAGPGRKGAMAVLALGILGCVAGLVRGEARDCPEAEESPTAASPATGSEPLESTPACARRWSSCVEELSSCQGSLAACTTDLDRRLAPHELFLSGTLDEPLEQLTTPLVEPHFGSVPGLDWTLECRTGVCRVDLYFPRFAADDVRAAQIAIAGDPEVRKTFGGRAVHGRPFTEDLVTGEILATVTLYLDTRADEAVR